MQRENIQFKSSLNYLQGNEAILTEKTLRRKSIPNSSWIELFKTNAMLTTEPKKLLHGRAVVNVNPL